MHIHFGDLNLPTLHIHLSFLPTMEKLFCFCFCFLLLVAPNNRFSSPFPIHFLGRVAEKVKRKISKFIPPSLTEPASVTKTVRE